MSNDEIESRTTKVEISNPNPATEETSHSLAIEGINSIMEVLNDHRYIISIKMEIEHVEQPLEDYPQVFTAEIPNTPENNMEFLVQQAELQFRQGLEIADYMPDDMIDQMANIVVQHLRSVIQAGGLVDSSVLDGFIQYAIYKGWYVISANSSMEEFKKNIENMPI